nr:MAG TPA: minor capsid protein [Caudoviricetes sp.]
MYQDLEDWILQDIAMRLVAAGSLSGTADRELWKLQQMGLCCFAN